MTTDVDRLMKRCQVGVGGRRALDEAHDILSECYGTLGRQQIEIERLTAELAAMTADRDSWADQASQRTQDAVDLVAKERERCAKLCEDSCAYTGGHGEPSRPSGPRRTTMTDTTHADSERNQPLGLASTDLLGLVERLRAELAAEEACARLHAGLLREVAVAIGHAPGDDRSTLPGRVRAMRIARERMQEWIEGDCTCPCCAGVQECVDGCTFAADRPSDAERMESARAVLFDA